MKKNTQLLGEISIFAEKADEFEHHQNILCDDFVNIIIKMLSEMNYEYNFVDNPVFVSYDGGLRPENSTMFAYVISVQVYGPDLDDINVVINDGVSSEFIELPSSDININDIIKIFNAVKEEYIKRTNPDSGNTQQIEGFVESGYITCVSNTDYNSFCVSNADYNGSDVTYTTTKPDNQ